MLWDNFIEKLGQNTQNTKTCRGRRKEERWLSRRLQDLGFWIYTCHRAGKAKSPLNKALASTEHDTGIHWTRHWLNTVKALLATRYACKDTHAKINMDDTHVKISIHDTHAKISMKIQPTDLSILLISDKFNLNMNFFLSTWHITTDTCSKGTLVLAHLCNFKSLVWLWLEEFF